VSEPAGAAIAPAAPADGAGNRPGLFGVDLSDPAAHAGNDTAAVYARLRRTDPVAWHPAPAGTRRGFWVLTRHADVAALCRDAETFSSARGNMLTSLLGDGDSAGNRMLVVSDAPRHTELRALVRGAFTAEALADVATGIRATTRRLLREAVARERVDFAADVAVHIPLTAICDLLGVPERDRPFILRQTSVALGSHEPVPATSEARIAQAQILLYFARAAAERRNRPGADLISTLVTAGLDGGRLTDDEVVLNAYSLILGGDETTRLSMIGGLRALAEHPDQWRRIRDGEVAIDDAVEEILRWTAPLLHVGRVARRDVRLHDRTVRAGDVVTGWLPSANRDEEVFTAPDTFDVGRRPNRHLTFAHGPHFCVGARLARIELSALLEGLRDTVGAIEPDGAPAPVYSSFVGGLTRLPLRLRPPAITRTEGGF
jgi:cytochrome P450